MTARWPGVKPWICHLHLYRIAEGPRIVRKGKAKTEGSGVAGSDGGRREHLSFIEIGMNLYDNGPEVGGLQASMG